MPRQIVYRQAHLAGRRALPRDKEHDDHGMSVILPTHNRSELLQRCLFSLESQSFPAEEYEVVIVDDGSTDETKGTIEAFQARSEMRLTYLTRAHRGPASARNEGAQRASYPIFAFIDDDCVADGNWLRKLRDGFEAKGTGAVEGRVLAIGPVDPLRRVVVNMEGGQYLTANIAYRRDTFQEIGGFDETFPYPAGEDYDLAWRCIQAGYEVDFSPEALVWHPTSYEPLVDSLRRLRTWRSIVYLAQKHPDTFLRRMGRGIHSHLLFYAVGIPAIEFLRHSRFLLSSLKNMLNWGIRRLANSAYCLSLAVNARG